MLVALQTSVTRAGDLEERHQFKTVVCNPKTQAQAAKRRSDNLPLHAVNSAANRLDNSCLFGDMCLRVSALSSSTIRTAHKLLDRHACCRAKQVQVARAAKAYQRIRTADRVDQIAFSVHSYCW